MRQGLFASVATVVAGIVLAGHASAATISVESKAIQAGQAEVELDVTVTGGASISSLALTIVIGDGGVELGGIETVAVKNFRIAGGIFDGPFGVNGPGFGVPLPSAASIVNIAITDAGKNAIAQGLLGKLVLDTSTATAGEQIQISLDHPSVPSSAGNAGGQTVPLTFQAGTLTVVPEPASLLILASFATGLLSRRRAFSLS